MRGPVSSDQGGSGLGSGKATSRSHGGGLVPRREVETHRREVLTLAVGSRIAGFEATPEPLGAPRGAALLAALGREWLGGQSSAGSEVERSTSSSSVGTGCSADTALSSREVDGTAFRAGTRRRGVRVLVGSLVAGWLTLRLALGRFTGIRLEPSDAKRWRAVGTPLSGTRGRDALGSRVS